MKVSNQTGRSQPVVQQLSVLVLAVAATVMAGAAPAAELANYDALGAGRAPADSSATAKRFSEGDLQGFRGHVESRLGLPTFLIAPRSLPKRTGSLLVVVDVERVARDYLHDLAAKYRISTAEIDALDVIDSQRLPNGAALVRFSNRVNGVEVFRDRVSILINADGALNSVGGYVSGAGANVTKRAAEFPRSPLNALADMLAQARVAPGVALHGLQPYRVRGDYSEYLIPKGNGQSRYLLDPARIKPVWFRMPTGLIPAYYGELQLTDTSDHSNEAWSYVFSADDGRLLFRNNLIAEDVPFNYRVFAEATPPFRPFVGPQERGGFPHPTGVPDGFQPPFVAPNLLSLISAPFSMGDPWLSDAASETLGNNVDAFANLAAPDGYQPFDGDLRASLSAAGTFDYGYNTTLPPNANNTQAQASVTQLFYLNNWLHDWFYDAGFDEASGNAQDSNYGRGGQEDDSILAQAQDYAGLNNANMATPSDGGRPRMRMYTFTGVGPSQAEVSGGVVDIYATGTASSFGPQAFDVSRQLIQANDGDTSGPGTTTDACQPLTPANSLQMVDKIAFVDRGVCAFVVKALNVQNAGAVGMLLADNVPGPIAAMGGVDPAVTIPVLRITLANGNAIRAGLISASVNARLLRLAEVNRDGSLDSTVVIHEWGHYISNRLVGNANGLSTIQSGGMGEGWGDFHALLSLVQEGDAMTPAGADFAGVYATGGYDLGGASLPAAPNNSHYNGIRRYPYSTDLSRNPLTFRHIDDSQPLPVTPPPQGGGPNSEVHNTGEVWTSMLWECYAGLLNDSGRLSFDEAQERMKTYLVGGYKMTPSAPTFVEARDAILSVAASQDMDDFALCAAGFAKRGLGAGAVAPDRFNPTNTPVVESYGIGAIPSVSLDLVNDSVFSCDEDGVLDNGEIGQIIVTVRNGGFSPMSGATVELSSPQPELTISPSSFNVADMAVLSDGSLQAPAMLSGSAPSSAVQVDAVINHPDSGLTGNDSRSFLMNVDEVTGVARIATFEARMLDWQVESEITTTSTWVRVEAGPQDHRAFGEDISESGIQWLISPPLEVSAIDEFTLEFRARHQFEFDGVVRWDGGVIEISTNGGASWTDIGASVSPTYNGTLDPSNPLGARMAYTDTNPSLPALDMYTASFGTTYAGQTVMIRFGVATDVAVGGSGWEIDDVAFTGIDNSPFSAVVGEPSVCAQPGRIFGDGFEDAVIP